MYTAIVATENNRVAVYMEFATQEEAQAHVDTFREDYPSGFVYEGSYAPELWVEGEMVSTKPLPPRNVTTISAAALRKILLLQGKLDAVNTALPAIPDETQRKLSQIDWEFSQNYSKDNPNLTALFAAAGMSPVDVDQLFHDAFISGG